MEVMYTGGCRDGAEGAGDGSLKSTDRRTAGQLIGDSPEPENRQPACREW